MLSALSGEEWEVPGRTGTLHVAHAETGRQGVNVIVERPSEWNWFTSLVMCKS